VQVAVDQAAQGSPTGNLARKVRAVYEGATDVVQAAAALRKHTAERANYAQQASEGLVCCADAAMLKEHQDMLQRYHIKLYSNAMERHGQHATVDAQVSVRALLWFLFIFLFPIFEGVLFGYSCRNHSCPSVLNSFTPKHFPGMISVQIFTCIICRLSQN
jgi:hypothetical protein